MIFMWRYSRRSSSFHRLRSSPSCSWRLARASGNVRYEPPCTQHPVPSTQITLVATFDSSVRSWLTIRIVDVHALICCFEPGAGGHVEVVVGLVEQQHVGAAGEQHVEHEPLAFAAAQLADRARGEVVDRGLDAALGGGLPSPLELVAAEVAPVAEPLGVGDAVVGAGEHRRLGDDHRPPGVAQRRRGDLDQHLAQRRVGARHADVLGHAQHRAADRERALVGFELAGRGSAGSCSCRRR